MRLGTAGATLIALVVGSPLHDLATLITCGMEEHASRTCCTAAREARKSADPEARAVLDDYVKRNCKGK